MFGWLKVGEDVPVMGSGILVSDGKKVGVWRYRGFWPDHDGNGCCTADSSTELLGKVTHWKPFPAAPGG
ncbi:DUF551 domain-containing protein [Citrobacter amalonaticus]|uniref:DUF551 domain-containing protein n=1 Tax=Citrobacter amalonaticus TaxID=35703 RepID=UPI0005CA496F